MVRMTGKYRGGAVDLLEQHDPHQLMRPGRLAEGDPQLGALDQAWSEPVGAADDEAYRRAILRPPLAQEAGERRAIEVFAARA